MRAEDLAPFERQQLQEHGVQGASVVVIRSNRVVWSGACVGIERHARGRDLWHWGSNPGAKSLMIVCPETGDGVVILTNGSAGSTPMRNIAARVMGRKGCWRPGC